jgi:hypothetical protein
MKKIIVLTVFLASFFHLFASKPKVAVMDIHDRSGKFANDLLLNATEMMRGKLSSTGRFMVIDRSSQQEQMKKIIGKERKESYGQNYDQETQIPLGKALAADSILRSTISCLGTDCMLNAELVDIAKEASTKGGSERFSYSKTDMSSLMSAIESVIEQIADMSQGSLADVSLGSDYSESLDSMTASPDDTFKIIFDANASSEVFVDGSKVCNSTPCEHYINGGMHNIKMVSREMSPMEEMINFYRNERIVFQLIGKGATVAINPVGTKGEPVNNVQVLAGRSILGTAPDTFHMSLTTRKLVLRKTGYRDTKMSVSFVDGSDITLTPLMKRDTYRPLKGLAIAGFVVGGVSLVAGVLGMGVAEIMDETGEDSTRAWNISYGLTGIGLGCIALGVVFIVIKKEKPTNDGVSFDFNGSGMTLSYQKSF